MPTRGFPLSPSHPRVRLHIDSAGPAYISSEFQSSMVFHISLLLPPQFEWKSVKMVKHGMFDKSCGLFQIEDDDIWDQEPGQAELTDQWVVSQGTPRFSREITLTVLRRSGRLKRPVDCYASVISN